VGHPAQARHEEHSAHRRDGYARRRPEESVLYETVAARWPAFRERMEQSGGLPKFVVREFEEFLKCGILEEGCLHLVCRSCGYSEVVAFSCKRRGFCPGCLGRRMSETAVHLEERVLPAEPVRHWVCSLPWGLRALLGYDRELCAKVVSAFVGELCRTLARRAKHELGLSSVADAHTGAICAVQRTDGALRLNVHMHVLALDGVYVRDAESGKLEFHALAAPARADVEQVARRTAERIEKILERAGRSLDPQMQTEEPPPELVLDEPGLASCYTVAARGISVSGERAGLPALRLVSPSAPSRARSASAADSEPVAEVRGVNVHAKQRVDGRDRKQLERLCRYVTRPPLAEERLERLADGQNYVAEEHHFGDDLLVTRKGAIRAGQGELGIIPGSMGTKSFIVRGKGNPLSFESASHGAGRRMSRGQAKKSFTLRDLERQTEGVECRKDAGVIDEAPKAYKNIDRVMEQQDDLVEIVHELKQVVCVKG
jgi:hypothetical protein